MAKNITISLSTVFNGSGIKSAIYGMQEMQNVTKNVQQSLEGAKSKWAQTAAAFEATINTITKMNDVVQSMASAYSNAELNATRLEVIMRQRMKSTDAEIASIKKLTSAQADLGIISAGVQRAGAQQLATFLYQKSSLEVLIPAMNNLVAQQRGFSAEAGDAVNVANLMGKAMMGMTSALRRVGITFTEAQEAAIKNGNEQERAAMLAQIITDNVGEMNAALAKTDAGKQKQLANEMGALKAKYPNIPFYHTEMGPAKHDPRRNEQWWAGKLRRAFENGCESFTGWNLCLDADGQPLVGPHLCMGLVTVDPETGDFTPSAQYNLFRHIAPFVKPGAAVLRAEGDRDGMETLLFRNPDGEYVLVAACNAGCGLKTR